jgi:hypothetical protein
MRKMIATVLSLVTALGAPLHAMAAETVERQEITSVNLLAKKNAGFENGRAGWVLSAGGLSVATTGSNLLFGVGSAVVNASAASQTFSSASVAIPNGLKGANGAASCFFKTAASDYKIQVTDGTNVLSERVIPLLSIPSKIALTFIFPSSGNVRLRVISASDAADLAVDNCFLGENSLISIGQADLVANVYFPQTANCSWSRTNTALGAFTADSDCPAPVVESSSVGTWLTTDADLPRWTVQNLPPGKYVAVITGGQVVAGSAFQGLNFAVSDGTSIKGRASGTSANSGSVGGGFTSQSEFVYTSSQTSKTFELFGSAASGDVILELGGGHDELRMMLYRYPLQSEQAVRADTAAGVWSGTLAGSAVWDTTSTTFVDGTNAGSFTLTERLNTMFGTVVQATSPRAGVTFTPSSIGDYSVCMTSSAATSTAAQASIYQLWDGTNELALEYNNEANAAPMSLCGIYRAVSVAPASIWIRLKSAGGGATATLGPSGAQVGIVIKKITQSIPAPILVGGVVTPSAGVTNVIYARVSDGTGNQCTTGTCVIDQQSGGIASVVHSATGDYAVTFSAGTFSNVPSCTCSGSDAVNKVCSPQLQSSTGIGNLYFTNAATAAQIDAAFNLTCVGAK